MAPKSPRRPSTPLIFPAPLACINAWTMTPLLRSWSAVERRCSRRPRISRVVSFACCSCSRAAASASRRSVARALSLSSVDSASAISSDLLATSASAVSAPVRASVSLRFATSLACTSRSRSVVATSTRALAPAIFPSHGVSSRCATSSSAPIFAISPLSDSTVASRAASSLSTRLSSSAFFASSSGTSFSIAATSAAIVVRFAASFASFSSSFLARCFMFFRSSRCLMSLRSNSANSEAAWSSSARSVASALACSLWLFSKPFTLAWCSVHLARSCSSFCSSSALEPAILATLVRASCTKSWYKTERVLSSCRSLAMYASASCLAPCRASRSFSTSLRRFTCPPRFSLSSSSALALASMCSTYCWVPMISSRYSNRPSSLGFTDLGFIMEICSTSP
mmetsp:Transcript_7863/g.12403  ORF Transcript_7863/g.12403 Transcript_7863/m.12403 type:complete len:397 (-) Transcript_7863:616-1806(-)